MPKEDTGKTEEKKKEGVTIRIPKMNFWMITTVILAVVLVIMVVRGGTTGNVVATMSANDAANKAINYINDYLLQGQGTANLTSVTGGGNGLYNLKFTISGRAYDSYVTTDGKLLFPSAVDMSQTPETPKEQQQTPKEIPKTDKPVAELYIFSYCPAGSAALDTFSEAADFLKDNAVFKVKFFSNMHGEHERQQNMIQECIQRVALDKYWSYAKQFVEEVYQKCASVRTTDCDKEKSIALMKSVGIDSDKVMTCVKENGETYYNQDKNDASKLQLQYSPSIVINGVYLGNIDRSPEGIKSAVCSAFNKQPDKCTKTLGTSGATASGGCA